MAEKRLIDANSILDDFLKRYTEMERDGKLVVAACEIKQDFADMISNAATVDAVEVVRCKNCKHYNEGFCVGYHAHHDIMPDDFCSYGERKDGEQ